MSKFNVGDKVKYVGKKHKDSPEFYPPVGTIGTVVQDVDGIDYYIQWPKGSTSGKDCWYCNKNNIELVENVDMTNEEIWEMLRPKMEKNALTTKNIHAGLFGPIYTYNAKDVHNAIALAYKVGYLRSQKGRPFKIGEKKKRGGHWEPVDPNNLPKEGTKVRYSREYKGYNWLKDSLCIGTKGTLTIDGPYSRIGMMLDRPTSFLAWADFEDEEAIACLDMWVEDDE